MVGTGNELWFRHALALVALALLGSLCAPSAAGASPLRALSASPKAFTPAYDGLTDSTRVTVRVAAAGRYRVAIVRPSGRLVQVLVSRRLRRGAHSFWWDGRTKAGNVAPPGRYLVRAHPVGGRWSTRKRQRQGSRELRIRVKPAPLSIRNVRIRRAILARDTRAGLPELRYRLTRRANSSAVVRDARGRVVANLLVGYRAGGEVRARWNGRSDNGRRVSDGKYLVSVAATVGGRPTETVDVPLLVDRTVPTIAGLPATVRARTSSKGSSARLSLVLREPATIRFTLKGRGVRRAFTRRLPAGRSIVGLGRSQLGGRRIRPGRYTLGMVSRDAAGNRARASVRVQFRKVAPPKLGSTPPDVGRLPGPGGKLVVPVSGTVSSEFGPRWGRMHQGIDIAAPRGRAVVAAASGIVSFAGTMAGYGRTVVVEHPGGMTTLYAHLSKIDVVVGQEVARGSTVGRIGTSGNVTGPHLHFEIRLDGTAVNPRRYLSL